MRSPRIGFLVVGHPDYPNDTGLDMAERAVAWLREQGVDVCYRRRASLHPWDAIAHAEELLAGGVDGAIVFLATWVEAPVAIAACRELEHLPLAVWGFPMYGPERAESTGSFVAYAVVKAALERMGKPFAGLAGAVDDSDTLARALSFGRAAAAKKRLRRSRLGLVGYASMGMYCGTFDHALLRGSIGPEVDQVDTYTLVRRADSHAEADCQAVVARFRQAAAVAPGLPPEYLLRAARLYLGLQDLAQERRWDAMTVKCQYELSQDYGAVACLPLSLLGDEGLPCGCEGDVPTSVTMLALRYLTGATVTYGDLLDLHEGVGLLSSCGMAPFRLADEDGAHIRDIGYPGFTGAISSMALRPGTVTLARLAEGPWPSQAGQGAYALNVAVGEGLPSHPRQGRFPALSVRLHADPRRLLATLAGQHFAFVYGDCSDDLAMLASLLGVEMRLL